MSYTVDPDNNLKMIPNTKVDRERLGRAINPTPYPNRHERPTYILVNTIGDYSFAYESGSLASYVSGSKIENAAGGPIKLDIQPIAWTSVGAKTGDVTFVYKGAPQHKTYQGEEG